MLIFAMAKTHLPTEKLYGEILYRFFWPRFSPENYCARISLDSTLRNCQLEMPPVLLAALGAKIQKYFPYFPHFPLSSNGFFLLFGSVLAGTRKCLTKAPK